MIYFKHPDIKIRQEDFGGMIQTSLGLYALNTEEYSFISDFTQTENPNHPFMEKFLNIDAICSIEKSEITN